MFDLDSFLKNLSDSPGVYLMINTEGKIIYVGKAKNLKKRVSSYFQNKSSKNYLNLNKTHLLVSKINKIEITITETESEALILENSLIKQHHPKYNILFRDDKTYPYLYLSPAKFPQLLTYRGKIKKSGESFGPYPNISSTREIQKLIQKIFKLRDCTDSVFANRARPCLQYQLGRCSAPCVGFINQEQYQEEVNLVKLFLEGKNQEVLKSLGRKMQIASDQMNYELAMRYRDQINILNKLQTDQSVQTSLEINADVLGLSLNLESIQTSWVTVVVLSIRQGRVLGSRFYTQELKLESPEELIQKFIENFYILSERPQDLDELIIPREIKIDLNLNQDFYSKISTRKNFKIIGGTQGIKKQWVEMAEKNAKAQLAMYLAEHENWERKLARLWEIFGLINSENKAQDKSQDRSKKRIECVDISHHQGESTMASCVVFTQEGPQKSLYRKFHIEGVVPGDDYGAIYQVVFRRFKRIQEEGLGFPDLFLIDGGVNQLNKAHEALIDLKIDLENFKIKLVAVSKGPERKIGEEQLWELGELLPKKLNPEDPALHLIQYIRDEAHRFAIEGHRAHKAKKRSQSRLEDLPGIGPKRRRALLNHFGSLDRVFSSTVQELCKVEGISEALATVILKS